MRERVRHVGHAAVRQLRRPVETGRARVRGAGRLRGAQRVRHGDQRGRLVERVARDTRVCLVRRWGAPNARAGVGGVVLNRRMRSQPWHGRCAGRRFRRALAGCRTWRGRSGMPHVGRCLRVKRCGAARDAVRGWRRDHRMRASRRYLGLRHGVRRRDRCSRRGDMCGVGRCRDVSGCAAGGLNRVCGNGIRRWLVRADQPGDDAERADAPADGVSRAPIARRAHGTAQVPTGASRRRDGQSGRSRQCRRHRQRLPSARAVRPVDIDAGCRQCREAVAAGPCAGRTEEPPFAAERRDVIERSGARAGERAFDRDEGRWGHESGTPCDTGPCRRGAETSSQILPLWSAGAGRSIRSI